MTLKVEVELKDDELVTRLNIIYCVRGSPNFNIYYDISSDLLVSVSYYILVSSRGVAGAKI